MVLRIEEKVREWSAQAGLDIVRITSAATTLSEWERVRDSGKAYEDGSRYGNPCFWNPATALKGAKSVICAAECYLTSEEIPQSTPEKPLGKIARYTWRNYYKDVRMKLGLVAGKLKKETGAVCRHYSNGPIAEKPLAERAGVGWYGKNCIVRTKKYGSWIVLGEIVTDIDLKPDEPLKQSCGACMKCIESCPTGAFVKPYVLDGKKCLQHLTNWYGVFPEDISKIWGDRLYGCTTCQDACPGNKNIKPLDRKPRYGAVGTAYPLLDILKMTESEYFRAFRGNQMGANWIDFRAIRRNAIVALGNTGGAKAASALKEYMKSPDRVIRDQAAASLLAMK